MITANIEVNGKRYKLQHPGNREWIKLKKKFFQITEGGGVSVDLETFLDYCFEHVVFPEEGKKLNLDDVDLHELEEVWGVVLQRFCRGELDTGAKYKTKKR